MAKSKKHPRRVVTDREKSLIHDAFMCGITNDYIDMVLDDNIDKDPESGDYPNVEEVAFDAWFKDNYLVRHPSKKTVKMQQEKSKKLSEALEKSLERLKASTEGMVKTRTTPNSFMDFFRNIRTIL